MRAIEDNPTSPSSIPLLLLGAWGKTGINCFVLITGYFMCKANYTLRKLLKLYLQVLFYTVIIYSIFLMCGHETVAIKRLFQVLVPIFDLTSNNFVGCFIVFYLFIPFLNILINTLNKKSHGELVILFVVCYSVLPTLSFKLPINYIGWFSVLYLIASYIRLYGFPITVTHRLWGVITICEILLSSVSILILMWGYTRQLLPSVYMSYFFLTDANKLLPLLIGVSSFMYFKDLKIPYSRIINILGAATFGVLLIHTNSDAMRHWLWKETVNSVGHFGNDIFITLGYAFFSILTIFIICSSIEWFRATYIESSIMTSSERILKRVFFWLKLKLKKQQL